MNDEHKRRAKAAEIARNIRKRIAARRTGILRIKAKEDLFEKVKVRMVMRIYGVSSERAKEIITGRATEKIALEAENEAKREKSLVNPRRRVRSNDDEWIPMEDIIGMEVGESEE